MKRKLSIIISVIVVIGIILGITLGLIRKNIFNQNVGFTVSGLDAYIIYSKGTDILTGTLDPVTNYSDTAMSTEITLYKNTNKTIYGHIYLDLTTISSALAAEPALKWVITSNNTVLNEGNFTNYSQGDSIPLKLNIPLSTTEQKFQIYVWLDDSMDINDEIEGLTLSTSVRAEASEVEYETQPNSPVLAQGLIPVKYDTTNGWVKANSNNTNNDWYNYSDKKWANAVLVSSTNRSTYMNANAGTAIPEADVLAYYVWVPRFKYKVWNINKVLNTSSYNAQATGIDIKWEDGTESTGTISCNYNFAITDGSLSETCTGSNGDYYTHPAFTFGSDELRGIWVGKFELSSETPTATNGGGSSTSLTPRIKPNVICWSSNSITNFYKVIYDMQKNNNIYGLPTDRINNDSHIMRNMEWGAVTYLTNSKYGRCSNNSCTEVTINSNSSYYTGGNNYVSNVNQSTTGNIYGIYDMNGGMNEFVMANMSSSSGSYNYNTVSGGNNFTYNSSNAKYIDTYAYSSGGYTQNALNVTRLGDALGEVKLSSVWGGTWYSDGLIILNSSNPWFARGGNYSDATNAGLYYAWRETGESGVVSTRAVLISQNNIKPVISNLSARVTYTNVINNTTARTITGNNQITATLTDNKGLAGYNINTTNECSGSAPTSWTNISGTSYNLSTSTSNYGNVYFWVKDSDGNTTCIEKTLYRIYTEHGSGSNDCTFLESNFNNSDGIIFASLTASCPSNSYSTRRWLALRVFNTTSVTYTISNPAGYSGSYQGIQYYTGTSGSNYVNITSNGVYTSKYNNGTLDIYYGTSTASTVSYNISKIIADSTIIYDGDFVDY